MNETKEISETVIHSSDNDGEFAKFIGGLFKKGADTVYGDGAKFSVCMGDANPDNLMPVSDAVDNMTAVAMDILAHAPDGYTPSLYVIRINKGDIHYILKAEKAQS